MSLAADLFADVRSMALGSLRDAKRREQVKTELRLLPKLLGRTVPRFLAGKLAPHATLARSVSAHARRRPSGPAILSAEGELGFGELDRFVTGVARALRRRGIGNGGRIALLGRSSPAYLGIVLGGARAGVAVALPSPALRGELLVRALRATEPELVIAEAELAPELERLGVPFASYGPGSELERVIAEEAGERFEPAPVELGRDYVFIFTSGTTGYPKACRVTHERALLAASTFSELIFEFGPGDRLYAPLPLHHSSALLLGAGSCLAAGVPIALRRTFSASEFWSDVRHYDASALLYIGELCRALVAQPERDDDRAHRVRVAVGNGLAPDVWPRFRERFGVRDIREFYAATDVPSAIVNLTSEPGSVGHLPLGRTRGFRLLRLDASLAPVRDAHGRGVECAPGAPGELVVRVRPRADAPLGDVPVYTEPSASASRLLSDVFEPGDCYYRTGDLLAVDAHGYLRFVERAGDSLRFKGENVSCAEVEAVLARAPGVVAAAVVGVSVPGVDGSPPLAVLATDEHFSLTELWRAVQGLPSYAQPRFVRLKSALPLGETLKVLRRKLAAEGVARPAFVLTSEGYVELTAALWDEIVAQQRRL